jgi:hypothetical protein
MAHGPSSRHYLAFNRKTPSESLTNDDWVKHVGALVYALRNKDLEHKVVSSPSRWHMVIEDTDQSTDADQPVRANLPHICAVEFAPSLSDDLHNAINDPDFRREYELSAIGADLPIRSADYWNPAESLDPMFATRQRAHALMGIDEERPRGTGVNVVIVDQGLDKSYIEHLKGKLGGGWHMHGTKPPGEYPFGHGSMLARNILAIAPDATLFDVPAIPTEMEETKKFISTVHAAFNQIVADIEALEPGHERWRGPWIFVNAWATFNRGQEHPDGNYSCGEQHQFNQLVNYMTGKYDMVFAAGNCGQFCPSWQCGTNDIGPKHSIIGANSLPNVLTVGAVRADGMWLGYSSQGPGTLSDHKPDLCAASQFSENDDAGMVNTGTSAACACASGIVAALRSRDLHRERGTATIKKMLRRSTGQHWDNQLGYGIINLHKALEENGLTGDRGDAA